MKAFAYLVGLALFATPLFVMAWKAVRKRMHQRREERRRIAILDSMDRARMHSQAELERKRHSIGWTFERRTWRD